MPGHAIITGGSSGIGLAIARLLSSRGTAVSLIARDPDRLAEAKTAVSSGSNGGSRVQTFSADVREASQLEAAIAAATESFGAPDWGVSSAGIVIPGIW